MYPSQMHKHSSFLLIDLGNSIPKHMLQYTSMSSLLTGQDGQGGPYAPYPVATSLHSVSPSDQVSASQAFHTDRSFHLGPAAPGPAAGPPLASRRAAIPRSLPIRVPRCRGIHRRSGPICPRAHSAAVVSGRKESFYRPNRTHTSRQSGSLVAA